MYHMSWAVFKRILIHVDPNGLNTMVEDSSVIEHVYLYLSENFKMSRRHRDDVKDDYYAFEFEDEKMLSVFLLRWS